MADELEPEKLATATSRVQHILAENTAPTGSHSTVSQAQPAPAEPTTEKRTRTTVAKLLQKYQERVEENSKNIADIEKIIIGYQQQLSEARFKQQFWLDAIAEINAD